MNVDDLPVDQVLLQIEVIALVFERRQTTGGAQLKRSRGRFHHFLRGNDEQAVAVLEHQAGHFAGIGAGGHSDVFERPRR